jgi:site-specific recombinase XerD
MSATKEALRRERMEIALPTLVELFVTTKQTEGRSQRTQEWYRTQLGRFVEFVGEVKLPDLNVDDARRFVAHLQSQETQFEDHPLRPVVEKGLSAHTVHGYVRALKSFSGWLKEEGFTSRDIFARLKRPKLPQPLIKVLADDEIEAILGYINPATLLGSRLYLIVLLFLDTGIRASELCTLKLEDTFVGDNYIKVKGKGSKERIVPFGATTKKALIRYLHTFRPEPLPAVEELILSQDGSPVSYVALAHSIKRLGRKAGVPRLHPHLMRHTFAVKWLMNGGDLMSLKLILGHTDISVTQQYLHLAQSHIEVSHHRFSPVDRLGVGGNGRRR